MINENKTRIIITISKDINDDLLTLCEQMGISKSAFVSMALGEKIMGYKKAFEIASETLRTSQNALIKPFGND